VTPSSPPLHVQTHKCTVPKVSLGFPSFYLPILHRNASPTVPKHCLSPKKWFFQTLPSQVPSRKIHFSSFQKLLPRSDGGNCLLPHSQRLQTVCVSAEGPPSVEFGHEVPMLFALSLSQSHCEHRPHPVSRGGRKKVDGVKEAP